MTGGLTNRRFWRADTAESRERGRGDRGFSFVDVMATVAVTGVLMAIAIPSIGTSLVDMRSNAGMRALQGHLRTAHDSAVAQRRIVEVQFIGTNEVRSTRLEGTGRQTLQTTIFENGMRFHVMAGVPDTPDGFGTSRAVNFGGLTTVFFQPDGSLTDAQGLPISGTVFLANPDWALSARAVTVLGPTGRVQGYRWDSRFWRQ